MDKTQDQKKDYLQFLSNPQRQGVWSLTIQPDSASEEALRALLNLRDMPIYRYRYHDNGEDEDSEFPAIVVPKLFAYLRYFTPKQKGQDLPPLFPSEREIWARRHRMPRNRFMAYRFFHEVTEEPRRLGPEKKRALASALGVFKGTFQTCSMEAVPESPSTLDVSCDKEKSYFQVWEDFDGRITVYAIQEETCLAFKRLFAALPNIRFACESRKVFSPEAQLLGMYMPALKITAQRFSESFSSWMRLSRRCRRWAKGRPLGASFSFPVLGSVDACIKRTRSGSSETPALYSTYMPATPCTLSMPL